MSKIVPMDELQEYDIWTRYISPAWSEDFKANTLRYDVRAISGDIMLCLVIDPRTEDQKWQFVKITKNYTGYVDRVALIARAMSGKNLLLHGVRRRLTPAQQEVIERLTRLATPIKLNVKDAL